MFLLKKVFEGLLDSLYYLRKKTRRRPDLSSISKTLLSLRLYNTDCLPRFNDFFLCLKREPAFLFYNQWDNIQEFTQKNGVCSSVLPFVLCTGGRSSRISHVLGKPLPLLAPRPVF